MQLWRQLRWQIVGAQMLVVVVGVLVLALNTGLLSERVFLADVRRQLDTALLGGEAIEAALLASLHRATNQALFGAAVAATIIGLAVSLALQRQILQPLTALAASSQRIATGRYDERVAVPASDELRAVAVSFNQMAGALEQVEQQRVAMIGNVAHELRTPLAGIEGYLEGLIDGIMPSTPETFGDMQHEVRRLRRLVDDLQTLSRVEAGQVALRFASFDLCDVVRRVVAQVRPQVLDGCLEVVVEGPDRPLVVRGDPDRTAQIILNLLGNAVRYTPEQGCITVRLAADDEAASVSVEDDGIGIPPEALPYIFERFYRVDQSRARSSGGSGIGLTISRHLAWAMGGDITAASPGAGQGSTFTLQLPLA
jgi:histidine kinase